MICRNKFTYLLLYIIRCECPDEAPFLSDDGVSCLTAAECDAGRLDTAINRCQSYTI